MQSYTARLASFSRPRTRWPHPESYLATPASLATAGFYFNPAPATPDAVSCFLCDKGLADWDPDDDPAHIHAEKCPKCPWAVLKCVSDVGEDGSVTFASPSRVPSSRPMDKARLATFGPDTKRWWPHEAKNKGPNAKTMAKAGFIYTPAGPKDDTCVCIYCSTELSGWLPEDDPMEEHRKRQSKNGPCPFFTSTSTKQRARSKSRLPPTTSPASDGEAEYKPPVTKSSTRTPAASTSSKKPVTSTKSKSSKKPAKTKTIEEEVVEEYHVALDEDEDAPPKPRPKPRRTSSRASSRASSRSRSRGSSATDASTAGDETDPTSSSAKKTAKTKTKTPKRAPSSAPSSSSTKAKSKSKKRSESDSDERPTRSRSRSRPPLDEDAKASGKKNRADSKEEHATLAHKPKGKGAIKILEEEQEDEMDPVKGRSKDKRVAVEELQQVEEPEPMRGESNGKGAQADEVPHRTEDVFPEEQAKPAQTIPPVLPKPNRIHHTNLPPDTSHAYKSFQSPEDEEFAREEQALEEKARELMLADETLNFTTPGLERNNVLDKGKRKADATDTDASPPPPSTPPPRVIPHQSPLPHTSPTTHTVPQFLTPSSIPSLTPAERAMTVEQWVRHEMDTQYERLRSDGRAKIDAFKARAEEVARRIEGM